MKELGKRRNWFWATTPGTVKTLVWFFNQFLLDTEKRAFITRTQVWSVFLAMGRKELFFSHFLSAHYSQLESLSFQSSRCLPSEKQKGSWNFTGILTCKLLITGQNLLYPQLKQNILLLLLSPIDTGSPNWERVKTIYSLETPLFPATSISEVNGFHKTLPGVSQ